MRTARQPFLAIFRPLDADLDVEGVALGLVARVATGGGGEHAETVWTWLIKRRIETVFHDIGRRDLSRVLPGLATNVHHRFAGDHALGGERHSREGVSRWFERLFRLFPELTFSVHSVHAAGWPWRLTVTATHRS